jgi:membrane-associated phospholipid phosphatase
MAYLLCYPLVPAAFLIVWLGGSPGEVARFWVAVLLAGYACYATLPWLVSRPPRLVTGAAATCDLGAVNAFVLGHVSHQMNTFPSGHVAVSLAAAAAIWPVSPIAGLTVGVIAGAVAMGAVSGRYHYVVDVVAGVAVAVVAAASASMIVPA